MHPQPSRALMRRVTDQERELAWLLEHPDMDVCTGLDPLGWPASVWVLHAMYENPRHHQPGTYENLKRRRLTAEAERAMIGDVNLDEMTTNVGVPLHRADHHHVYQDVPRPPILDGCGVPGPLFGGCRLVQNRSDVAPRQMCHNLWHIFDPRRTIAVMYCRFRADKPFISGSRLHCGVCPARITYWRAGGVVCVLRDLCSNQERARRRAR